MREVEKATNTTGGKQQPSTETTAHGCKAKSSKEGEDDQRRTREEFSSKSKKSTHNNSDDDLSRRSKKTRSDDDASSPADATGNGDTPNLEGIKGSLKKKGSGSTTPKCSEQKAKKTATFAEAVSKGATDKLVPAIAHKRCVVAFSVRVDKGKDTQAVFGKKIIAALSFLQTHIDKQAAFVAIDESTSDRPPIK